MIDFIVQMFSYGFIRRAILVGVLVALSAALLGVCLVLKRYSMIGDGLSHVGFGAMAIALALNFTPLYFSIPVVIIAAFFLLKISENSSVKGDAAIAIISSSAIAIGMIAISLSGGTDIDINDFMFGSILLVTDTDLYISIGVSAAVIVMFILLYNKIMATTFDEDFVRATGTNVKAYNMLVALLTAIMVVVGMRSMGTLLISSLIIFPALTSMRVFKSFKKVVVCAAVVSVFCVLAGFVAAHLFALPPGSTIVVANLAVFLVFSVTGRLVKA